jgi:hypothetical protein
VLVQCSLFPLVFVYLERFFISPSIMKDGFAGYSNPGWQFYSFRASNTLPHVILAFKVSLNKFAVILMNLHF